jgi:hypothetical protein
MLVPAAQNDPETERSLAPRNRKKPKSSRKKLSRALRRAWESAINVTPRDVAAYKPSHSDIHIAEALTLGNTTIEDMVKHTQLKREQVREILGCPVAMAWISEQCERLFKLRKGIVDATLYARAVSGDIAAMKLYYERTEILQKQPAFQVNIGQMNYEACSDDDLIKILAGKLCSPEGQIIDIEPVTSDRDVVGPEGAGGEDAGGAVPVLPQATAGSQETAEILPASEGREEESRVLRGKQVRKDDSGGP